VTITGTWYPPALGTGQFLCNPPFMNTPNRDEQHGGMEAVGPVSQQIKIAMRDGRNWERLTYGHQEALDMIAHKVARILSGANPHDPQHWEDVAGYAQAAMRVKEALP
jgi:hypothetical protein